MNKLAINGGTAEVRGPIRRFNTIGQAEVDAAVGCLWGYPLSGYLAGEKRGGWHVEELERRWCEKFNTKNAVSVNSATSGLLVACMALGVTHGTRVATTPFTMSATAAMPAFLGADIHFADIEEDYFCISHDYWVPDVMIAPNIFGQPTWAKHLAKNNGIKTIEDNAQAIGAMNHGRYAGTIADIGVFSCNYHKHVSCGEGGMCVTDDDELADRMRDARNHGEVNGGPIGLNLRLTEIQAALMLTQLDRLDSILASRIHFAESLTKAVADISGLSAPAVRHGCSHAYYSWALKISDNREWWVRALQAEGVPIREGYVEPLYNLPAFKNFARSCPTAERMHYSELATLEICSIDPTPTQIAQMGNAFHKVYEHLKVPA